MQDKLSMLIEQLIKKLCINSSYCPLSLFYPSLTVLTSETKHACSEYSSNFYGGFGNTGGGGGGNFSRRGPGASNSYYTPNYSGGAERGAHLGGGRDQGGPRQNYRQNNNSNSGPGNRISQPGKC